MAPSEARLRSQARLRSFVIRHTRLVSLPDVPGVRLRVASDSMAILKLAGTELGLADPPLPFWAFPWPGGLAIARHLLDHPEKVSGRRVVDVASGSGLCAIVASRQGGASVLAIDVDPLSEAAVAVNARANGLQVAFRRADPLDEPPPDCDVILAGDVSYEQPMADRMLEWLRRAHQRGTRVLLGDPGRRYLAEGLQRLATYDVHTTREIEDAELKAASAFTFAPQQPGPRS